MSSNLGSLARAIIAHETDASTDARHAVEAALSKLHDAMVMLIGTVGYAALVRRAIHLAKPEHEWLGQLVIATPFAIEQLEEQTAAVEDQRVLDGGAALLATLLQLLCAFIGEPLTLRQVNQVWTDISTVGPGSSGKKEGE